MSTRGWLRLVLALLLLRAFSAATRSDPAQRRRRGVRLAPHERSPASRTPRSGGRVPERRRTGRLLTSADGRTERRRLCPSLSSSPRRLLLALVILPRRARACRDGDRRRDCADDLQRHARALRASPPLSLFLSRDRRQQRMLTSSFAHSSSARCWPVSWCVFLSCEVTVGRIELTLGRTARRHALPG